MAMASAAICCTSSANQSRSRILCLPPRFNPHEHVPFPPFAKSLFFSRTNSSLSKKWSHGVSLFPSFLLKNRAKAIEALKKELLDAIAPLDRGTDASPDDKDRVDQIARALEAVNPIKEPVKSELLNGKWELIYTTSNSTLQSQRPKFLRPSGNYQAINVDTLRAQNMESWPFFNQVTADLNPLNPRRVAVRFDTFKIAGFIQIKAPGRARGELEITYLDEELRISRGDKGNLFILKMVDPSYTVPLQKGSGKDLRI